MQDSPFHRGEVAVQQKVGEQELANNNSSGLLEIKDGHYGEVNLDGISLVMMHIKPEEGKAAGVKYYISEAVTDEQFQAAPKLMEAVFSAALPNDLEVLSSEKAPISVERSANKIRFSVPGFKIEIEMMKSSKGRPFGLEVPLGAWANHYVQYKSTHSVTNAYTAKWDISNF